MTKRRTVISKKHRTFVFSRNTPPADAPVFIEAPAAGADWTPRRFAIALLLTAPVAWATFKYARHRERPDALTL